MINKNDHITLKLFDDINFEILKKFRVRYFTSYTKFVPTSLTSFKYYYDADK